MKFGALVATRISDWQIFVDLENLGYDRGWVPDSQMIWSDCYATMALAATYTSRIKLGTGVSVTGTRIAPVTASSIASINQIAPGRIFLGIGTGNTAMRVMGFDPIPAKEFREYLRVVRALLHGEEVEYTYRGKTRAITLLHQEMGFFDTEHPVPMYVAANGPMALEAAGAYGDGRTSYPFEPTQVMQASLARLRKGAQDVGRELPNDFMTTAVSFASVLKPGESPSSDRVIDEVGHMVTCVYHYFYEEYLRTGRDDFVDSSIQNEWGEYLDFVKKLDVPPEKLHQRLHLGHCTYLLPEERRFVTPNAIKMAGGLVGEPDEIIHSLKEYERNGLKEVMIMPPTNSARESFKDFAEHVMERY
jgi:alkanesulfonate monooxygenase SsuD/methylene tetrahydromethanopterin reductase-like flavin-dependent oxidoreductase (luciferase family)